MRRPDGFEILGRRQAEKLMVVLRGMTAAGAQSPKQGRYHHKKEPGTHEVPGSFRSSLGP
jgi:hypothetical protein